MTSEELAKAIRDIQEAEGLSPTGYHTTEELAEVWGVCQTTASKWLKRMRVAGYKIDCVKVKRPSVDGRLMLSYAYRIE